MGDLLDHVACLALERDEAPDDRVPRLGVDDPEGEVFEFLAHPLHPHPSREGREDVHRLTCLLDLLFQAHRLDRAHVVQPVGELHQDHAQVFRHGDEELAEVLCLLGLDGRELQVGKLRHAVDEFGDLVAESCANLGIGRARVLDRVVQKRGDDCRIIEMHLGQDRRNRHGMGEIGLARVALLPFMRLCAIGIGPADQVFVGLGVVVADQRDQVVDIDHTVRPSEARGPRYGRSCASMSALRSFSSDMSSSTGRSASAPMRSAIASSSGSSTSIWVW